MTATKTPLNITERDIRLLEVEAAQHGDLAMVMVCEQAIHGDTAEIRVTARIKICDAINAAQAMQEEG
jgi:hypothetical protein